MKSAAVTAALVLLGACAGETAHPLANADLSAWGRGDTQAPDGWTLGGPSSGVIAKTPEGATFRSDSTTPVALYQDVPGVEAGAPLQLSARVRTRTPNAANIAVSKGPAWWVDSPRHSGDGEWQELTLNGTSGDSTQALRVHVWARDGATVEVRDVRLAVFPLPWTAHLPGISFSGLLLIALALVVHPRSRRRLAEHITAPARAQEGIRRPENLFSLVGGVFGLCFLITTPPFQVPDEPAHFRRVLQLSQLDLKPVVRDEENGLRRWGAILPVSLIETEKAMRLHEVAFDPHAKLEPQAIVAELGRPYEAEKRDFYSFGAPAMYAPLPYLPQLAGVLLGRALGASPLSLMYLARLFNLVAWLLLVRLAIRAIPIAQWGLFALALSPMSVCMAGSLSPDVPTNALSFLTVATVLSVAFGEEGVIPRRRLLALIGLFVALALAKQIYLFLSVLLLLIPVRKLGSMRRYLGMLAAVGVGQLAVNVGWWAFAMRGHSFHHDDAKPAEQLAYLMEQPWRVVSVTWNTLTSKAGFYATGFVGNLGWLTTPMPNWLVVSYFFALITVALFFAGKVDLKPWHRALAFGTAAAVWIMILVYHYLIWNPPRFPVIEGGQGRYLIPLSPLVLLAMAAPKWRWRANPDAMRWPLAALISVLLVAALIVSAKRFYVE